MFSIHPHCLVALAMLCGIGCGKNPARQGQEALENKDYEKAIVAFSKAIEANPKDAESYRDRGDAYLQIDKVDQALADFNKALRLDP